MEESFEMLQEELQEAPRLKSVRQVRRPEMYTARRMKEETPPPTLQQVPKTLPREPSQPPVRTMSLRKSLSIQNLSQVDAPWENVTLNRCLFVAITILVLASGFQRLHEAARGRRGGGEEEEEGPGLTVRRPGLRHKAPATELETRLWDVLFWWLPDLGDGGEEGGARRSRGKSGAREKGSRGGRNRRLTEGRLTKEGGGRLKDRRAKRDRDAETKAQKEKRAKPREEEEVEEDEEEEEVVIPKKKEKKSKAPKS